MKKRNLVIATSRKTRGGITSVVKSHEQMETWQKWNCKWIVTNIDKNLLQKILFFINGYLLFLFFLPSAIIVHIHLSGPKSAYRKNIFLKTAKLSKKLVIIHFHAFSAETTLFGNKKRLYEKMFNKADAIIALSNVWKQQIQKVVDNPAKIKVIYNPCPSVFLDKNSNKKKEILFAGVLNQRKGYADLIKAFALIAPNHPDWKIIFAGSGEINAANDLVQKLNISDQVIFAGWIYGKKKEALFNSASIFCLPSYAEGFPMAILDAWAYGLPVITTPVGGLPEILKHKKNALVFKPGDVNKLAENLELIIKNEDLRNMLSERSIELSKTTFNIQTIAKQLDNLYTSLTSIK